LRPRVYWTGAFFTNSSLAIVNRRLVSALIARDNVDITVATDPLIPDALPDEFRLLASRRGFGADEADFVVAHQFPTRFAAPAGARCIHFQPWEFGSIPLAWFQPLHDDCDDVWVYASANRDAYIADGIDASRVAVIPLGIDPAVFNPDGPRMQIPPAGFRFLFVGGTLDRKGVDVLLAAYQRAFRRADDVALTIKDANTQTLYKGQTRGAEIQALAARGDVPRIEYSDAVFPDAAMAQLFRAADCLVLPYRGEGFALPVLEAMACRLPVIVTAGGATDDFVDERVGWRVPATRRELSAGIPVPTLRPAWLLEPDVDALAAAMREAFQYRDETRRRGNEAAQRARTWTWDRSASIVERRIAELCARPAIPGKDRAERYRNPANYTERIFGSGPLDGVVLELFRRIGTERATFVDVVEHGAFSIGPALGLGMGWRGVAIVLTAGMMERARERYRDCPRVAFANDLRLQDVKPNFDLLALDCSDAGTAMKAVAPLSPRVVACGAASVSAFEEAAIRANYVPIARDDERGDVLYVRGDLTSRCGFAHLALLQR